MCLILCAHETHSCFTLVIAANRDELLSRPTAAAAWWEDASGILAGRDLEKLGTWLGLTKSGRFAAVTNFREPAPDRVGAPSRGLLVRRFLEEATGPEEYLAHLATVGADYNGFNLLFGAPGQVAYYSNRGGTPALLAPGIYGISNHLLDTPWPKVRKGKDRFGAILGRAGRDLPVEELFELLSDRSVAPDDELPDTGLGIERERAVSAIFTSAGRYGTRCSTVVAAGRDGTILFVERDAVDGRSVRYVFSAE